MPPFSLLLGKINFSNLYINLTKTPYATLADAKAAGAATLNYGMFISNILDFLIVAFVIFMVIRQLNKLKKKAAATPVAVTIKECPFCKSQIAIAAIKCPNCTSDLK
jgi:large conductance mechanosensitive channel